MVQNQYTRDKSISWVRSTDRSCSPFHLYRFSNWQQQSSINTHTHTYTYRRTGSTHQQSGSHPTTLTDISINATTDCNSNTKANSTANTSRQTDTYPAKSHTDSMPRYQLQPVGI